MADIRELMEKKVMELSEILEKKVAEVENRSAQVEKSSEELDEEKRMMSTLLLHASADADIIELNVGGTIFHTKRATLLAAEGSLLAAMFSGRWEDSLDRDKEGRVFFDFDPAHFRVLLNHLRLQRIAKPEEVRPAVQQTEYRELFDAMIDFLGMRDFLYGPRPPPPCCDPAALECARVGGDNSTIRIDGCTISGGAGFFRGALRSAVGKSPALGTTQATSAAWKVAVTKLQGSVVVAGIIANPTPDVNSWTDATSFGWSANGKVWTAGQPSGGGPVLQKGDSAIFRLDVVGNRLRMFLERTGQIHDISLREGVASQARLHFVLWGSDQQLVLSTVTADEVSRAGL